MKKILMNFAKRLIPSFGSVVILTVIMSVARLAEPILFPVVSDFKVSEIRYVADKVIIHGTATYNRSCTATDLTVYGLYNNAELPKEVVEDSFMDAKNKNRSVGEQQWGPWTIVIPQNPKANSLEITASYRCHSLWDTTETLTKFLIV